MKVIEHLDQATGPLISFEIIPPLRGGNLNNLLGLIEGLAVHRPPFIDITSHAAELVYDQTTNGYQKRIKRKRPGTLGICALIQHKFAVDAVPHLLCEGFTREETENFLVELRYLGIDNVLALRGDSIGYDKPLADGRSSNSFASDLVHQIAQMNRGIYLEELADASPSDFCVGVAGYPEKHEEAPNMETDIARVRQKVEAGAEYIVTQMFFENSHYFRFVEECRSAGIEVPIIPGVKILATRSQLSALPNTFNCEIPIALSEAADAAADGHVRDIGVAWALEQTQELLKEDVPAVHFYVMQSTRLINRVLEKLDL